MKDPAFIQQMILHGDGAKEKVKIELFSLSTQQLHWNPPTNNWSIAQCLDHLIISDNLRIEIIKKKAEQNFNTGLWERINPLNSFWGAMLKTETQEKVHKKIKAPRLFYPSITENDTDILIKFESHFDNLLQIINNCTEADIDKVHVTSPVSRLITYSLRNAIGIIIGHERRHINQAIRVKKQTDFPTY